MPINREYGVYILCSVCCVARTRYLLLATIMERNRETLGTANAILLTVSYGVGVLTNFLRNCKSL
jgi:hypothetical protein